MFRVERGDHDPPGRYRQGSGSDGSSCHSPERRSLSSDLLADNSSVAAVGGDSLEDSAIEETKGRYEICFHFKEGWNIFEVEL